MLRLLKAFVARLFGRQRPPSGPPDEPYAGVRQPLKRGPSAGHATAAVMEPEPSGSVDAGRLQNLRTQTGGRFCVHRVEIFVPTPFERSWHQIRGKRAAVTAKQVDHEATKKFFVAS